MKAPSTEGLDGLRERKRCQGAHSQTPVVRAQRERPADSCGRGRGVSDARVGATEHEATDALGIIDRELLSDHPAH